MPSFNGTSRVGADIKYTEAGDHDTGLVPFGLEAIQTWATGTGSNQANRLWSERNTLVATSVNRDLFGVLVDRFGNTLSLVKLKEIWIHNLSTVATEQLLISGNFFTGAMLSGWVDDAVKLIVGPGGFLRMTNPIDGWVVTDTTQERLTIDSGSDTIIYDLVLFGHQ